MFYSSEPFGDRNELEKEFWFRNIVIYELNNEFTLFSCRTADN